MKMTVPALVLAASLSALAVPAYAYDNDEHIGHDIRHIQRDHAKVEADERRVREEQAELSTARREMRHSWWTGNFWGAHKAAEKVREEENELRNAHHKLNNDVADIRRDRADLNDDLARHHRWW